MKYENLFKHGLARNCNKNTLYKKLINMKHRCYNKSSNKFKDYGERGISICKEWLSNPLSFIKWALDNGWEEGLQIDRINNDGNYEPDNCRFVTAIENNLNKRLLMKNNSSGFCGVTFDRKQNKWHSKITINKERIHLGSFDSPLDACKERDMFIIKNKLNYKRQVL